MQVREMVVKFWYTPEFQDIPDEVSFELRPLTEPDMVAIEELYNLGRPTGRAHYEAGVLAIVGVKGITGPDGNPLRLPAERGMIPRHLVKQAGYRAICAQDGTDWAERVRIMSAIVEGRDPETPEPAPHEDPGKN